MVQKIFHRKHGSGPPVILLHGFPMHHSVWIDFAGKLADQFTVYTPDLPGFGKSPLPEKEFSLSQIATLMNQWVEEQSLVSATIIGHSMGGYIALEMVKQQPGRYNGLGLFHSTALEDTAEKKESRTKVVKFIDDNGVLAFTSNFIPPLFANQNHPAIPFIKAMTIESGKETVQRYTVAMRDRKDNTSVIREFNGPVLLLGGDKDKGISVDSLQMQEGLKPDVTLHIFQDTGHMGMFEKGEESLNLVKAFLFKIYKVNSGR
jgi:pimeloyl-ACP methyl ester carboxylesterase